MSRSMRNEADVHRELKPEKGHGWAMEDIDPMDPSKGKHRVFVLDLTQRVVMEAGFGQRDVKVVKR